jgi:hypothetical protein
MIKNIIFTILFSLIISFSFLTCGGMPDKVQTRFSNEPYYVILVDKNISPDHKWAVVAALNDWIIKTDNVLKYELRFVDMTKQDKDEFPPHTIKLWASYPGEGLAGWTAWHSSDKSAYILIDPAYGREDFRRIMMHELGHAFDLSFDNIENPTHYMGEYKSVMHPGLDQIACEISCPDITAFCQKHNCEIDCINQDK